MVTPRIDEAEVRRIAGLARLSVSADEIQTLVRRFESIVEYFSLLQKLPDGTAQDSAVGNAVAHSDLRPDEPMPGLSSEIALSNAPDRCGDCFRVPAVLSDQSG